MNRIMIVIALVAVSINTGCLSRSGASIAGPASALVADLKAR